MNINNSLSGSKRILSLDVFRGLTIMLMIIVNSQGSTSGYPILEHATWNGCTLADLVFPFFLFIVGMTLVVSLQKHMQNPLESRRALYVSIVQRTMILFVFGLLLNAFPYHFTIETLRFYGILQRIAVCYLFASLLYLNCSLRTQVLMCVTILIGYWLFLTQASLDPMNNWVAYIDRLLLAPAHLLEKTSDPEGLLSTIPSIVTTMMGVFTGVLLLNPYKSSQKCLFMMVAAVLLMVLGWMWGLNFPLNKSLWTSSFVLWTAGIALFVFALTYFLVDIKNLTAWTLPFKIFGMNALFAFIFHVFLLKVQSMFAFPLADGTMTNMRTWLTYYLFSWLSPANASLAYSLVFLSLNFVVVAWMYSRRLFVRI